MKKILMVVLICIGLTGTAVAECTTTTVMRDKSDGTWEMCHIRCCDWGNGLRCTETCY